MRRCVSALLGVSALVLCISGLPLTVDSAKSLGRFSEKLEKLTELRDAEKTETVDFLMNNVDKEVDSDAELDPVERNYPSPTGGSPYGASPYGASPYGSSPYGASPYGSNPYGSSPHGGSPYGGSPYGGSPGGSSYGGSPYGGSPYGGSSHGGSPYGGSPYGASPYGGSQYGNGPPSGNPYGGKSPSNNYGNSYGSPVTSPSFHSLKPTTAAQNMYSQGNGQSYGTVSGDSYDSYNQYGRRRRSAAELEARTDAMLEKLKNFVEDKAESKEVDTTLEENAEPVERLGQYDGYSAPYGNTYGAPSGSYGAPYGSPSGSYGAPYGSPSGSYGAPYSAPYSTPYGNSYNAPSGSYGAPYSAPYGNSYGTPSGSYNAPNSAPYGNSNSYGGSNSYNPSSSSAANSVHQPAAPDSAKINQAAASTKSIYMTGGTSSTRPQDSSPYQYQPAY